MNTTTMSFAIFTPSSTSSSLIHSCTASNNGRKASTLYVALSNSSISIPKNGKIKSIPQLGLIRFAQWDGLKLLGSSISQYQAKMGKRIQYKCKHKGVYASLFGVGAPEALVIGVVALLVFGPKGLAEVARNLGKTLREFQPTIRELQEVSREFKSTLEREIGLDDVDKPGSKSSTSDSTKPTPEGSESNTGPNGNATESAEDSVDDEIKIRADQLRQTLLQLQKEQEEERAREEKEKAEQEQTQAQVSKIPVQDTLEASQDSNNPKEASSSTETPSQTSESNAVQEAAPILTTGSVAKSDTET